MSKKIYLFTFLDDDVIRQTGEAAHTTNEDCCYLITMNDNKNSRYQIKSDEIGTVYSANMVFLFDDDEIAAIAIYEKQLSKQVEEAEQYAGNLKKTIINLEEKARRLKSPDDYILYHYGRVVSFEKKGKPKVKIVSERLTIIEDDADFITCGGKANEEVVRRQNLDKLIVRSGEIYSFYEMYTKSKSDNGFLTRLAEFLEQEKVSFEEKAKNTQITIDAIFKATK